MDDAECRCKVWRVGVILNELILLDGVGYDGYEMCLALGDSFS